jgi:hypothetical protein
LICLPEVQAVDPEVPEKITPKVTQAMNDGLLAPFSPDDVKKLLSALVISRRRDQTAYVQFFTNIFGADAVKKLLMKFWKP